MDFKFQLFVFALCTLVRGAGAASTPAAKGEQCSVAGDCDQTKGLVCTKPFKDCDKGYCLCPFGEFGYAMDGDTCKTGDLGNEATCPSDKKTCNTASKFVCTSNKCACGGTGITYNSTSGMCEKDDKTARIGEVCATGMTDCVAKKGKVGPCTENQNCACDSDFKDDGNEGCTNRISYKKDDTCGATKAVPGSDSSVNLCNNQANCYINDGTTVVTIDTSFVCTGSKCACPTTGNTVYVLLTDNQAFCKESTGTKAYNETCTNHGECTSTMACGKCPGDSEKKCHKDMQDSGAGAELGITFATVAMFVSVNQLLKL